MNEIQKINTSIEETIQEGVKSPAVRGVGIGFLIGMARANSLVPAWWSFSRDLALRRFWKESDHLSGAIGSVISKLTTIPFKVVARDMSIKRHVKLADEYTEFMVSSANFGSGWIDFFSKWIEDYLGQDNGSFIEIIGDGKKDSYIEGMALGFANLDSSCCWRTNSPIYPVVYRDPKGGGEFKLHYSRVIFSSQMPSSDTMMNGVGFCSVSRCLNLAQNLIDISTYKQEKFGSRPKRQMLLAKGGLDPEDIVASVSVAEQAMNNQGLSRFSKTVVTGSRDLPDAEIEQIDLSSLPDGFDEQQSTILGMSVIALALGVDIREIFPVSVGGSTKSDAIIEHIKQRGKTTGQILKIIENQFNQKFLPSFLKMQFDYQDDAQDRQSAEIRSIRSQYRQRDIMFGVTNVRVERQIMLENGEITREQFEELELNSGRLDDGVDVDVLFYSKDKDYSSMLSGVDKSNYEESKNKIMEIISVSNSPDLVRKARRALAAINKKFDPNFVGDKPIQTGNTPTQRISVNPDKSYENEKFGRTLGRDETAPRDEESDAYSNNGGM